MYKHKNWAKVADHSDNTRINNIIKQIYEIRNYVIIKWKIFTYSLCFGLSNIPFVVFRIHQFSEDLSGMAARIEMVCVCKSLAFASLFSTVTGKNMLVVIVVEVFVFVNVVVRHSSWFPNALENNSVNAVKKSLLLCLSQVYFELFGRSLLHLVI